MNVYISFASGNKQDKQTNIYEKMKHVILGITAFSIAGLSQLSAEEKVIADNDTIKTLNIDEIVVTSSAKETNDFRTIPGSVSVFTPQLIAGRQIDALKDLSSFVPNLYIPDYGSRMTSAIYIRGIGARSSGQSIGMYVDDVPYLDKSTFDFELSDIQSIEVLRGPQGTLYGRNSMGGIVKVYTISPFDFQGKKISLSAGNYGNIKAKASHYGMLSDKIGFTAGVYYDHSDGYFTNEYTGEKADKENVVGGRIKLEGRFSPNFKAAYTFSGDYTSQGAFPYGLYDAETGNVAPISMNDKSSYNRSMFANQLLMEYKNKHVIFTSTTGHQFFKDDMKMDQDFSSKSIFTLNQKQKQHSVSQEFALRNNNNNNYQWSLGLYGFYSGLDTEGPVTFKEDGMKEIFQESVFDKIYENAISNNPNSAMPRLVVLDKELYIPGSFKTPSYGLALFHQSTYNNLFIEGLSITAGVRLDYEKQSMNYKSNAKMKLGAQFKNSPVVIDLSDMYNETVIDLNTSQDFWQVLPKVSLKYECSPKTFTYFTVAKGYKTGGYNVQMSADVMQTQMQYDMMSAFSSMIPGDLKEPSPIEDVAAYKPEQSWNYELGMRSELIENHLNAELSLFYMDIKDVQLTKFVDSGNGRILTNAGKARSFGAEVSLKAQIIQGLTADANFGYTNATFTEYDNGKEDFKGKYIPYTPRHTASLGVQYTKMLRSNWIDQFYLSANVNGTGKIFWTEYNNIYQNFYATLNARAGVRKGILNVCLWGKNLTNTTYSAFYFESRNQPFMQLGKPLQVGVEVSVNI